MPHYQPSLPFDFRFRDSPRAFRPPACASLIHRSVAAEHSCPTTGSASKTKTARIWSPNYPTTIQQLSSNIQQLSNNMTKLHFNIIQPSNIHPTRSNPPDPQSYWASRGIASAKDSEITRKLEKIGKVWHLK